MSLDTKLLLDEIARLFDEQNAKWDAVFSRKDDEAPPPPFCQGWLKCDKMLIKQISHTFISE